MIRSPEMLGKVQTPFFGEPILFDGILMGNCSPTDCDAMIEYHGKGYLFFEYKYGDASMPVGQELAYTRLINDLEKAGKKAALFECHHRDEGRVRGKDAVVTRVYMAGKWHPAHGTVQEMTSRFQAYVDTR